MIYDSIDHGNDETCHTLPVVLFLVFRKNNFTPQHGQRKPLDIHLSFEHFMTSFLWSTIVQTMENCGQFVNCHTLSVVIIVFFGAVDFSLI